MGVLIFALIVALLPDHGRACSDKTTETRAQSKRTMVSAVGDRNIAGICPDSPRSLKTLPSGEQILTYQQGNSPWIVFQRRHSLSNSTDFNKDWASYEAGFGQVGDEFWMGLNPLYNMCNSESRCELLINLGYPGQANEVPTQTGGCYFAHYDDFYLDGPADVYKLHVSGYSGSAGDSMLQGDSTDSVDGMRFSTAEADHDRSFFGNCANVFHSGWWFNWCGASALNRPWGEKLRWFTLNWGSSRPNLSYTDMMVKVKGGAVH